MAKKKIKVWRQYYYPLLFYIMVNLKLTILAGSHTGIQSIAEFYCSLAALRPDISSKLDFIFPAMILKFKTLKGNIGNINDVSST